MKLKPSQSRLLIAVPATLVLILLFSFPSQSQNLSREEWGAMPVTVAHDSGNWIIAGKKNKITINDKNLALTVDAAETKWSMEPSSPNDLISRSNGQELPLRLADAKEITIVPYDAAFKTGIKITLSGWIHNSTKVDLRLFLTVCLEGPDEDLVFDISAVEGETVLRQLDWPAPLDAREVDFTVLSNGRGTLLPRNWSKEYFPIRTITPEGKIAPSDHSVLQSHVIESWSMSWWGFQKGKSAMMVIVETPDDAAYQFKHPAGGPTVIGPRWLAQLDRFAYSRAVRMCFFPTGDYVTLAKRYRRYVMDTGLFVSLQEKIARTPLIKEILGVPQTRVSILRNLNPESDRYNRQNPESNYSLTTFAERARQLRDLKARGFDRVLLFISGWPHLGYDRQHPDSLPPPEKAGGWQGLRALADTARELGFPYMLHDQYRDYYKDAPSYDPQFAVREEDASLPPRAFPGSRFGDFKDGDTPFMRHWDGGVQAYLSPRFMLGHLLKNYQLFFEHGIHPQGIYLDVFGYVPPDEDFNPEHPTSRTESMRARIDMLNWSRQNLGIVATEAGADFLVPYVDTINQSGGGSKAVLVPLYQLVYHDAIIISYNARDEKSLLQGLLFGGVPELPLQPSTIDDKRISLIRAMAKLHERVGLLEMTRHQFLDPNYKLERTTFADGTTVTVDWDHNSFTIQPELKK